MRVCVWSSPTVTEISCQPPASQQDESLLLTAPRHYRLREPSIHSSVRPSVFQSHSNQLRGGGRTHTEEGMDLCRNTTRKNGIWIQSQRGPKDKRAKREKKKKRFFKWIKKKREKTRLKCWGKVQRYEISARGVTKARRLLREADCSSQQEENLISQRANSRKNSDFSFRVSSNLELR